MQFKNLGLLVIDEEHRFGVTHKERIKQLRASVDVLTLTATPIPRTLYMALSGVRDLSVIETPPLDRLPVETDRAALQPRPSSRTRSSASSSAAARCSSSTTASSRSPP